MLHKGFSYEDINKMPYFRFQMLVDTWSEEINEEKERQTQQQEEINRQQSISKSNYSLPDYKLPSYDMPKF